MLSYVITDIEIDGGKYTAAALYEDQALAQLSLRPYPGDSRVGSIYSGMVESVSPSSGGAFVRIDKELFYMADPQVKCGEVLPVQIIREATGGKRAVVSKKLTLVGRTVICGTGGEGISFSSSLKEEQKTACRAWAKELPAYPFHFIFRTAAGFSAKAEVLAEADALARRLESLLAAFPTRTLYSCVYREQAFYRAFWNALRIESADRIVTDREDVYAGLSKDPLPGGPSPILYEDPSLPLPSLYNMNRDLGRLLSPYAYLPCGGFLVIEKTEAFTAIDVNSGKNDAGRIPEEIHRRIDLEAAAEAARQIRLRNLSGMILIDFINLSDPSHRDELLGVMRKHLKKDPLHAEAVDITRLGIMEIIRKKEEKSISETAGGKG